MKEIVDLVVTPVQRLDGLSRPGVDLWVKRDDRSSPTYGGNKPRKLAYILAAARARGATRLVTLGAVGSHHVLATAVFGARAGFAVEAVLVPQPRTAHAVDNVRADVALGVKARPAGAWAAAPIAVVAARPWSEGTAWVTLGGSDVEGTRGYVAAARELAAQVRAGAMPEPDVVVVALGSGGTAAGLAAGFAIVGMRTRVIGVCVSGPIVAVEAITRRLVRAVLRAEGAAPALEAEAQARLVLEPRFVGGGYGEATEAGARATEAAAAHGVALDPTYTAKAFAAALARVEQVELGRTATILYWHTLSSAPLGPILARAPREEALAPEVRALLR